MATAVSIGTLYCEILPDCGFRDDVMKWLAYYYSNRYVADSIGDINEASKIRAA
jgi:hypothetical protein